MSCKYLKLSKFPRAEDKKVIAYSDAGIIRVIFHAIKYKINI